MRFSKLRISCNFNKRDKKTGNSKNATHKKRVASYETTLHLLVAEAGLEPHDLRVMSPASYQLLHSAISIACT